MRKLLFYLFTVLTITSCTKNDDDIVSNVDPLESQWKVLESSATNDITDVYFPNDTFGVVCGSFGTLLKTEDSGNSWQKLDVGVGYSFSSVFALDQNEFFTSRLGLYKTINSGASFDEIGNLNALGATITDIHFFNLQEGLICKGSTILTTSDSGKNWTVVYNHEGYASILEVTNDKTIYLAGGRTYDAVTQGEMHKSIDNGDNWKALDLPDEITNSEITAIDFLDNRTGYIATFENKIFKTIDGGENWNMQAELGFGTILGLVFIDEVNGYLINTNKIYSTFDSGKTWLEVYRSQSTTNFTCITATPNGNIFAGGQNGLILKRE